MKTTYVVILSVMLLPVCACAQKVNDPADMQVLKKSLENYAKAVNARDIDAVADLMTDNATYAGYNAPVSTGKEAIRSMHTIWFSLTPEFSCPVEDVRVVGDLAVARGDWTAKYTPKAQGIARYNDSGSWVVVFARQSDGSWKWDWCLPNSNQPLPGSTASGEDEQALYQVERDWNEAALKKDAALLDKILADEFQANYASFVGNKKQTLASLKSDPTQIQSSVASEMKAFVIGDQAIVNGLLTVKSSKAGKDTSGQQRYTDVFVNRDGRWQCVTGYSVKVQ